MTASAPLPSGWTMRRVALDARGCDVNGWLWGPGDPLWRLGWEYLT